MDRNKSKKSKEVLSVAKVDQGENCVVHCNPVDS